MAHSGLIGDVSASKASRLRGPRFLTSTSSASAEGANNIKAAKVTVRDLEGTEDSINHSSAADDRRSGLSIKRCETCEQVEHLRVWRSNPAIGVSVRLAPTRRISAPHATHH